MSEDQRQPATSNQPQAADLDREPAGASEPNRRVLVAGSSGLIGSNLCLALQRRGWTVERLVRQPLRSASEHFWDPEKGELQEHVLRGVQAVVNLCGAGIGDQRWTSKRKSLLRSSRIDPTTLLAGLIAATADPPAVFLNASAAGYYGQFDNGPELTETSVAGDDFLARLCVDWEAAAVTAVSDKTRVILSRTGMILARDSGALKKLLPLFSKGLGGVIGSGRQWMSWISLTDAIRALVWLLEHPEISGPVNVVSPNPMTNHDFTRALARALNRPALLPVPAAVVTAALGEMGDALAVKGNRVVPERLLGYGFEFKLPEFSKALEVELNAMP